MFTIENVVFKYTRTELERNYFVCVWVCCSVKNVMPERALAQRHLIRLCSHEGYKLITSYCRTTFIQGGVGIWASTGVTCKVINIDWLAVDKD